jgi:hypothetical protein
MNDLITFREAERLFGLSFQALCAAVRAGYIKCHQQGRRSRLSRMELASHPETRREQTLSQMAIQIGFKTKLPVAEARQWLHHRFGDNVRFDRYSFDDLAGQFQTQYLDNGWRLK